MPKNFGLSNFFQVNYFNLVLGTKHIKKTFEVLLLLSLFAFSACNPTKRLTEDELWLYKQNINIDNPAVEKKKLKKYYQMNTNKLFFGIPVPVYFFNLVDPEKEAVREQRRKPEDDKKNARRVAKGKEPKQRFAITRWLLKIGEPIAKFNEYEYEKTKENFVAFLKTKGYYYAEVKDSFETIGKQRWVTYMVSTGQPYIIDTFSLEIENKHIESLLEQDSANFIIKEGAVFDSDMLKEERSRITYLLKSKSYFLFKKEYIRFYADTNRLTKKVNLELKILNPNSTNTKVNSNHKQFKINDIHIYLGYNPREDILLEKDYLKTFESLRFNNIVFHYKGKSVLDPNVILRGLYIKGDSLYNFANVEKTYRYLTNLKTFKLINIGFKNTTAKGFFRDTEQTFGKLDCIIKLTPTLKQSYSIEAEANISSYGDYGAATTIRYENHNLWRKAIALDVNTKAARENIYYENRGEQELFKVNIIGGEVNFLFPKFLFPTFISPVKAINFDNKYKPKTNFNISVDYQQRFDYTNLISTFNYGYQFKTNNFTNHYISAVEFSTTKVFNIRNEYIDFVFENDIWSSFFDNVLLGIGYRYVFNNHNPTIYDNAHFFSFGAELSGNLLSLVNSAFNFGDVKIPYSEKYAKSALGLPYFQFAKIDLEYRKYWLLNNEQQLVFRSLIGIGLPYGNVKFMPIQKQYYSGGASSIRAWAPKRLGPGALNVSEILTNEPSITYNNLFQNSDMKLEFNLEHRFNMFWKLDGAFFVDVGNIWALSDSKFEEDANFKFNKFYKELAIGSGAGIRLNFTFFVARLDLGVKLLDPVLPGSNWAWKKENDTKNNLNLNFSIGYPF